MFNKKKEKETNITAVLLLKDWSTELWWLKHVGKSIWLWIECFIILHFSIKLLFPVFAWVKQNKICDISKKDEILRRWDWIILWLTGTNPCFYKVGILFWASSLLLLELKIKDDILTTVLQSTALIFWEFTDFTTFLCKLLLWLKDHSINRICWWTRVMMVVNSVD